MMSFPAFLGRIYASAFVRDAAILTAGTASAQVVSVATMPLLSRLYTPADFGFLAVFSAVSGIVATLVTLRYETAILLPKEEGGAVALVRLCILLTGVIAGSMAILALFLTPDIGGGLGIESLGKWLPLAVLSGAGGALCATVLAWFNRKREYTKIALFRIFQSGSVAALGIVLGLIGTPPGLVIAQLASQIIAALLLVMGIRRLLGGYRDAPALKRVASSAASAPKFLLPAAMLDVITLQLPVLLITGWFSATDAGQFSLAWRVLVIPITLVGSATGQVFYQRFSHAWPDATQARKLLLRTWKALALIGSGPMLLFMFFGEPLFVWVFGPEWSDAGRNAGIMAPMLWAMLISSPTSSSFLVLGLQRHNLFFGISFLFYRFLSIWIGLMMGSLATGLYLWVIFEIIAILIFNALIIKRIDAHEVN